MGVAQKLVKTARFPPLIYGFEVLRNNLLVICMYQCEYDREDTILLCVVLRLHLLPHYIIRNIFISMTFLIKN